MSTYPYRAAAFQYGTRKGTLGLCLHMSEGGDGLVSYLAGSPSRGVSANFALLSTGEMWRMTPFDTASGSLNPADRSTDKAYYGHKYLVDVLGDHWTDPNTWCISLEIAGKAVNGPNAKQVAAIVAWAADMKARFPTIRGAFGHADQTDTKGCPGTTAAMKGAFAAIGGHGLWTQGDDMVPAAVDSSKPKIITTKAPTTWYELDGKTVVSTGHSALTGFYSPFGAAGKRAVFAGPKGLILVVAATQADVVTADWGALIDTELAAAAIRAATAVKARP